MAKKTNEAKVIFNADTKKFNDSIQKANSEMSQLGAELKLADAKMQSNGKSVEALEQKQSLLNKQHDLAEKKVDALNKKIEVAKRVFGENSDEVTKLKTQLANAQTAQEKLGQAIEACSNDLDLQKNAWKKLDDATEEAGEGFTVMKGAMADLVSEGIQSVVSGIGDLFGSLMELGEETKEYRTIMASLDESSKLSGYSAEETAKTFEQLNGVLGDTQASATTTANLQAIGLEQSKLQELTNGVIGAWAKYGDSIPIDGLGEAVNHTVKLGEVQGTLADVLEWAGITTEDFNKKLSKCSSEAERADLISKMLAEQGLTQAGKAWQETNQDIVALNNSQADYEANTAQLAENIAPATTAMKDGFNSIFGAVVELTEGVDFEAFGTTISGTFEYLSTSVLPVVVEGIKGLAQGFMDATTWAREHEGVLIAVGTAIGIVTGAVGLYNAVSAVKSAMDAIEVTSVWALVKAHGAHAVAVMASLAPYIAIVAGITAVIAIIVLAIKHWDEIVAVVKRAWEAMKQAVSNGVNAIKNGVSNAWNSVKTVTSNAFNAVKSTATNVWNGVKTAILTPIESAKKKISSIVDAIKKMFSDMKLKMPSIKTPKFAITPKGWKVGDLLKGSIPKLSITWNKEGAIFTRPTIFDTRNGLQGVGEAGAEAILPIDKLEGYVANAVEKVQRQTDFRPLASAIEKLAERAVEVKINDKTIATATASANDNVNGLRSAFRGRGLILE